MGETLASIMSTRNAMSAELKNVNEYLQVALDYMARGVSMYDGKQRLILCNKMYGEIYGIPKQYTRPGTPLSAIIRWYIKCKSGSDAAVDVSGHLEWIRKEVAILANGKVRTCTQELFNGRIVRITTQPLPNGGWVDVQEDITEQSGNEARLNELVQRDPLTELPNSLRFRAAFEEALRDRGDKGGFAVHVIDVGSFQSVKASYGIAVRDAVMQELAKTLTKSVSSPNLAARIDGDVFAVIQNETSDPDAAYHAGRTLENALSARYDVYGHSIDAAVRVATVLIPRDGKDGGQVINSALQMLRAPKH